MFTWYVSLLANIPPSNSLWVTFDNTAREMAMKQSQKRMEKWKAKDWEEKKQEILGVGKVGNRFLLGGINNNTNNTNGSGVGTS